MKKSQLRFAMDKLGFEGKRRDAMEAIIIRGVSSYAAESMYLLVRGTASRDSKKCTEKWRSLVDVAIEVGKLK
jgi:hypothetical protein